MDESIAEQRAIKVKARRVREEKDEIKWHHFPTQVIRRDNIDLCTSVFFTLSTTNGYLIAEFAPWNTDHVFYKIFHDSAYSSFSTHVIDYTRALPPKCPNTAQQTHGQNHRKMKFTFCTTACFTVFITLAICWTISILCYLRHRQKT